MTGLVSPSRSTSGNISFCTAAEAGYCRVPRPAAVITAFRTFAINAPGSCADPRARGATLFLPLPSGEGRGEGELRELSTRRSLHVAQPPSADFDELNRVVIDRRLIS